MGRPTKLTPELQAELCRMLEDGCGRDDAAEAANIHRSTFYQWMADGEANPDSIFSDFSDAIKRAESICATRNARIIRVAAEEGNWQAAAWWLERKRKKEFGRNETIEHTGADGGAIKTEVMHEGNIPITAAERVSEINAILDAARARADQAIGGAEDDQIHPPSTDAPAS
jgi:hypothetical protein